MFQTRLVELRSLHNMTQEDLARKLGVSRVAVAKWETGRCMPDVYRFRELACIFGITMEELLGEEPPNIFQQLRKNTEIFGCTHISEKGQIVIPVRARRAFHLEPGDMLVACCIESGDLVLRRQYEVIQYWDPQIAPDPGDMTHSEEEK